MSKKNNLAKRKRLHEFELQREKQEKLKKENKLQAKKSQMKIDGKNKMKKKGSSGFPVGKRKLRTKLSNLAKAKAAQAMELDMTSKKPLLPGLDLMKNKGVQLPFPVSLEKLGNHIK